VDLPERGPGSAAQEVMPVICRPEVMFFPPSPLGLSNDFQAFREASLIILVCRLQLTPFLISNEGLA
jgi:hypothetical protein